MSAERDIRRAIESALFEGMSAKEFVKLTAALWQDVLAEASRNAATAFKEAMRHDR